MHRFCDMLRLQGIGDDAESVVSSSATIAESEAGYLPVFFEPRPLLNLQLTDNMPSLCPTTDMKVRTTCTPAAVPVPHC